VASLKDAGVLLEEKAAIFLYMSITGLTVRHVEGAVPACKCYHIQVNLLLFW